MINQGVARAFARVRRPGVLTFAAVSEVGVSGRRVDGGHSLNSQIKFSPPHYFVLAKMAFGCLVCPHGQWVGPAGFGWPLNGS